MNASIEFREFHGVKDHEWDKIVQTYSNATVFHFSCWHKVLQHSFPGQVIRLNILREGEVIGHWCGLLLNKYGMKVFGAPLPGSSTDYMFPLFQKKIEVNDFLNSLFNWAKEKKIAHIELGGDFFMKSNLVSNQYKIRPATTYRVDLTDGEETVWRRIKPAMRNKIRKAWKKYVEIKENDSNEFAVQYYDMLKVVFKRQGLVPTYGQERIENILHYLRKSGNVFTLSAWNNSEPLSTALFLMDKKTLYFWGGASYPNAYQYGANDLIHWKAFQFAFKNRLKTYDTCGGGEYKKKFGGQLVEIPSGYLSLNPILRIVRYLAIKSFTAKQKFFGFISNIKIKN